MSTSKRPRYAATYCKWSTLNREADPSSISVRAPYAADPQHTQGTQPHTASAAKLSREADPNSVSDRAPHAADQQQSHRDSPQCPHPGHRCTQQYTANAAPFNREADLSSTSDRGPYAADPQQSQRESSVTNSIPNTAAQ